MRASEPKNKRVLRIIVVTLTWMRPELPILVKEEATKITPGGENVGKSFGKSDRKLTGREEKEKIYGIVKPSLAIEAHRKAT